MLGRSIIACALLCLISVPASAASSLLFQSSPGDYIGGGTTQQFDAPTYSVTASGTASRISLAVNGPGSYWTLDFVAPTGESLETGKRFAGATRWPFNSPTRPGLSVSGNHRGCNQLTGWFEVAQALFNSSGAPLRLAINFVQRCDGGPPLYGAVRYNSEVALEIPAVRVVVMPVSPLYGRDVVALDGTGSFSSSAGAVTYSWQQLSGTPVTLNGGSTNLADFIAPLVGPGGEDLVFRITASRMDGASDQQTVRVPVRTLSDPQTYIQFRSDSGDYIGGGRTFRMTTGDGSIAASTNHKGGVSIGYNGNTWYHLDFGPPSGTPFTVAPYENAQRLSFADPGRAGIDIGGDGRGCNTITGRFDVLNVLFGSGSSPAVLRFAANFEQHCEGGVAALRGEVRYNYVPTGIPVSHAGTDQSVNSGGTVVLDGRSSSDDSGVTTYRWRQVSGPAVTLLNPNAALTQFIAPGVSAVTPLTFQLLAADAGDLTAVDTVVVNVSPAPAADGAGGGAFSPWWLLLAVLCRRKRAGRCPRRPDRTIVVPLAPNLQT